MLLPDFKDETEFILDDNICIDTMQDMRDLEAMFIHLERVQVAVSTEGLTSIVKNIVAKLIDLVIKVGHNIKVNTLGIFKSIKRSELEAYLDGHTTQYVGIKKASYSSIYQTVTPFFPFSKAPSSVAVFCNDTLKEYGATTRLKNLISSYSMFTASIKLGDTSKCVNEIDIINGLNNVDNCNSVISALKDMVIVRLPQKLSTLGASFNSVKDFTDTISLTMVSSDEMNNAMKTTKDLTNLDKALSNLTKSLQTANHDKIEMVRLKGIASAVFNTGLFIESYGMVVKEYSHMEHYLTNTIHAAIKHKK